MKPTRLYPILILLLFMARPFLTLAQSPDPKTETLFSYNRYADAVKYLNKKVKKFPENAQLNEQLAFAYLKLHRFEEAEIYFSKAEALGGLSNAGLIHYGQCLIKNDKSPEAAEKFRRFIAQNEDHFIAQLMLRSIERVTVWEGSAASYLIKAVPDLNSRYGDFSPIPYLDGLVYVTGRHEDLVTENHSHYNDEPFLTAFYAAFDPRDSSGFSFKKGKAFNLGGMDDGHFGPIAIDTLRQRVIYTGSSSPGGKNELPTLTLYEAELSGELRLRKHAQLLNNTGYSAAHPSLSPDGKTMVFASDMAGTTGGMDLYYMTRNGDGWSDALNLSPTVNSPLNEVFPYLYNDTTLYFSSDGHAGYGGLDLFVSKLRDGGWTDPVNLKAPINSNRDDFGICYINENKGFFSSGREGGMGKDDIYGFIRIAAENDSNRVEIAGVFEYLSLPKDGVSLSLLDQEDNVLSTVQTDSNGKFSFQQLPIDQQYSIRVNSQDKDLLLNSNIYVLNHDGQKIQVMQREGASTFVFTTLPKDEIAGMALLQDVDQEMGSYNLFGQLFAKLQKVAADIELIAYGSNGIEWTRIKTDSNGFFNFYNLPKDQFLMIKAMDKDSALFSARMFYADQDGVKQEKGNASAYYKVGFSGLEPADNTTDRTTRYTVFVNQQGEPVRGSYVAVFNKDDDLMYVSKTNAQGSFNLYGTNPESDYSLMLPDSFMLREHQVKVHLVDRVANRFLDALPLNKQFFVFKTLPDVEEIMAPEAIAELQKPFTINGQVYKKLPGDHQSGMTLYAYDENGNLIETVVTDADGNFAFSKLSPDRNYLIKTAAEDAGVFNLLMFDESGTPQQTLRLTELQSYIYNRLEAVLIERLEGMEEQDVVMNTDDDYISGQIYYRLPGDYKEGIKVYAFNDRGEIIDSTYTDGKGGFRFSKLSGSEDFSIKVMDESDEALKVALFHYDGSFKGMLFLDENRSFKYSKIILEAAAELENEMALDQSMGLFSGQVYKKLPGDYRGGISVYAFDEAGNLIDVAQVDEQGNFTFTKLAGDQEYLFKFSEEDTEFNISLFNPDGSEADKAYATDGEWRYRKLKFDELGLNLKAEHDEGQIADNFLVQPEEAENKAVHTPIPAVGELQFGFRSAVLSDDAKTFLHGLIEDYRQNPSQIIRIRSHTDAAETQGDYSFSALRSVAIAQYLYKYGVPVSNISVTNKEHLEPLTDCVVQPCTEAERQGNRRSEVSLIQAEDAPPPPDYVVTFGFNVWQFNQGNSDGIDRILTEIKQGQYELKLDGYTDTWGSLTANERVAYLRVEDFKQTLIGQGVEAQKIEVVNHGESVPLGNCILYYPCPVKERSQNRRVELRLK